MRRIIIALAVFAPAPALADPGHLAAAGGHDHWIAAGVMGLAALVALWRAIKAAQDAKAEPKTEPETEEQGDEVEA